MFSSLLCSKPSRSFLTETALTTQSLHVNALYDEFQFLVFRTSQTTDLRRMNISVPLTAKTGNLRVVNTPRWNSE